MLTHMRRWAAIAALGATLAPTSLAVNSGRVEYYHRDALGNVRVVTDETGQVPERHDYLPFGEECTTGACATNPGLTDGQPRRFTGKERDSETGLDYFGARYYAQHLGRFTSIDPVFTWRENLLDPQRWNRYAYVTNNPLRYVDPDGRNPVVVAVALAVAFVLNNPTNANVTTGPTHDTIMPNSVIAAAGYGFLAGGARAAATEALQEATGLPLSPNGLRRGADDVLDVSISRTRSPRAARHIDDAQAAGHPDVITLDRSRARANRRAAQQGHQRQAGMDLDEYPPACCAEGGAGASIRPIPLGDNRSAGAQFGNQVRGVSDGTRVRVRTKDD